jgi:hypothetical protein
MKFRSSASLLAIGLLLDAAMCGAAGLEITPGLYEYTIKINIAGAPETPLQTRQRCVTPDDVAAGKSFEGMLGKRNDCKISDLIQDGGHFSYKVACNKPQKMDGTVKGSYTSTSVTLDMTVSMPKLPGPMNQTINARRVGDCKPAP